MTLVDPLLPNLRESRRLYMGRYQRILRTLERVQWIVPTSAVGWKQRGDDNENDDTSMAWLAQATHVIHLEPANIPQDYVHPEFARTYMTEERAQRLYAQHLSLIHI